VCVVPNLRGKTVATAKRLLVRGHCRLGIISRRHSATVAANRILGQHPRAGTRTKAGTKVSVVVSRGRR
jgi:serine/threonine-protein kinase